MQIPFADAVLSRLGRRGAALELIEEIEDEAAKSVDAADLLVGRARPCCCRGWKTGLSGINWPTRTC